MIVNSHLYIDYDTIPVSTRKKLPSKDDLIALMKASKYDEVTDRFFIRLEKAYLNGFLPYRMIYKELGFNQEQVIEYARHHAVWAEIVKIHNEKKRQRLRNLWEAYNRLYPGKYAYNRMNPCINTCRTEGIQRLLVHQYNPVRKSEFNDLYNKWILDMLSSGKGYSKVYIHKTVCEVAKGFGYKEPSLAVVKRRCKELEPLVSSTRNGVDRDVASVLPYASMETPSKSNIQWMIDGWRLPFYMENFKTLTLFWVMDACSGKIVGYKIAPSESTETILTGLENAVENTSVLPFEIVSDNHSFNKTSEAEYFKAELEKKAGTVWTVSSNPRYKSKVERSFKTFGEQQCKKEQGYIGEGIRTRNRNGRTTQELVDQYTKSGKWLAAEHIELIAIKCIEEYNDSKGKDDLTRNERYEANRNKEENTVDLIDRLRLFTRAGKYKVNRGQINIIREGVQYEFQLKASYFKDWNSKEVNVRYIDFDEIYIFDKDTDDYIGTVKRKETIHGAKYEQTEEDILKLNKHKGRLSGIKSDRRRSQIEIAKNAYEIDPEAAYAMNEKLTPKDIVEEFKANGHLKELAERNGIDLELVPKMPIVPEVKTLRHDASDRKVNKQKESPFLATEKEIREFDINKYLDEE